MWYIGQLLQNKQGQRILYAGFDFTQSPCFAGFRLVGDRLAKIRWALPEYKELPGDPVPIGHFARMLNAGFMGELDLEKLKNHDLYGIAVDTLRAPHVV